MSQDKQNPHPWTEVSEEWQESVPETERPEDPPDCPASHTTSPTGPTSALKLMQQVVKTSIGLERLTTELRCNDHLDQRWVSIGITHFQEGLSALRRAITRDAANW